MDIVYLTLGGVFFAAVVGLALGCARLQSHEVKS